MWGRKKLNTVAISQPLPPDAPPIINNYNQVPWVGIILAGVFCILLSLPVLWWILVFLFDRIGYPDPEAAVAFWVLILPVGGAGLWVISLIISGTVDKVGGYALEALDKMLEMEKTKLLTAQSSVDGMRTNTEDLPFARLIIAVMYEAIEHGPRGLRGEIRWSRRMAYAINNQHGYGLSERKCSEVATWLLNHGIINSKDEINTKTVKSLGDVKRIVSQVFNLPIVAGKDIGMSEQHLHGVDGDSWA